MEFESKLVPVLREGVNVIKMIFFKELKSYLIDKYQEKNSAYTGKLTGAVLNTLFGTPNKAESNVDFMRENKAVIDTEIKNIADQFIDLKIPLTDALRVQFLCSSQEGTENEDILSKAKELNILIPERPIPLPKSFMNLVRTLGVAYDILTPEALTIGTEEAGK